MTMTRDIVIDLLPLYAAGEASADTRAAVEAWLRSDPELARLLAALRTETTVPDAGPPVRSDAQAVLSTTRLLLRRRALLLAWASFFTGLPLSFVFDGHGLRFLLVRDAPLQAALCWAAGAGLWVAWAAVRRRLRVTGL